MFLFNRSACAWLIVAGLLAIPAAAQYNQFDNSANATLKGTYFVREVLLTNIDAQGTVGTAISAIGTLTFDGVGGYTFNGNVMDSNPLTSGPQPATSTISGAYSLAANGFLRIDSLVGTYIDPNSGNTLVDVAFGGVGAAGPNAFVASTTEQATNYNLFIGIPMNALATNASFNGTYNTAYLDVLQGDITKVRNATFQLNADGQGNLGNVKVSGYAANQNSTLLTQTVSGATYSLLGLGITGGTMNLGTSANLVDPSEAFMVSPDGTLLLGGSLNDFDMLVGTPVIANATAAMYKSFYFLGALEDNASQLTSEGQSIIDTFYGSSSVTGAGGVFIDHLRYAEPGYFPYDNTFNETYSVPASGVFQPVPDPDLYMLGANGQVVVMSGQGTWYSLMVDLQAPPDNPSGVHLNPLGVVNAANYAPATNPVAPLEMVIMFGNGMASDDFDALTLPVPTTTPDNVQVLVNGIAAPIFRVRAKVSPQLIYVLVPSSVTPANSVYYATFQVVNNGTPSNPVTLYTNYIAPGVFAISQAGIGDAAALDNGSLVTPANPANVGDTVELFVDGLGSVYPPIVPDGAGALAQKPFNLVDATTTIDMDTWSASLPFVGMAPYYTGLYQVNMTIPAQVGAGDWYLYLDAEDASGDQALASEATLSVAATAASGASTAGHTAALRRPSRAAHRGVPIVNGRKPVSGRLTHTVQ